VRIELRGRQRWQDREVTRVEQLPRIPIEGHVPTSLGNAEHPMRRVTRRAAGLEPGGWDDECRRVVAATFNAIINMFLFPQEVGRVLAAGGAVVWVNVSGPDTPIHLSVAEVVDALPFEADGVESSAGAGTWCVLRRSAAP